MESEGGEDELRPPKSPYFLRRRRISATAPSPKAAIDAGSGTGEKLATVVAEPLMTEAKPGPQLFAFVRMTSVAVVDPGGMLIGVS